MPTMLEQWTFIATGVEHDYSDFLVFLTDETMKRKGVLLFENLKFKEIFLITVFRVNLNESFYFRIRKLFQ